MAHSKSLLILIFILFVHYSFCYITNEHKKQYLRRKVEELRLRAERLYGDAQETPAKVWEFELEDKLAYPRGDKYKLYEISKQWLKYYDCCVRSLDKLTEGGTLPAVSLTSYKGSVAKLPCGLCIAPDENNSVHWMYSESLHNLTLSPMEEKETGVMEGGMLTIYMVQPEDAGVYKCQVGCSSGSLVVLEVVDYEENYTVVKPRTSHGPYAAPPIKDEDLVVFTSWSSWSGCSRCGRWGRRRRYGMCHVKYMVQKKKRDNHDDMTENPNEPDWSEESKKFVEAFPGGIPCRSRYLPANIKNRSAVSQRPNELMIAMCKPACKTDVVFKMSASSGPVLERANNSAGVFSLAQPRPPQPPPPPTEVLFAVRGQPALIRCPGTTLRDVPVTWRVGQLVVWERTLDKDSGSRMRVNARDHLVIDAVWELDANVYSCWQRDVLAGEVKLEVWSGSATAASRVALVLGTAGALYTLHLLSKTYRSRRRGY